MLKLLKNNRAQAAFQEYTLVFFLMIGMVTAMTIYFRRAVQARIHDARNHMVRTVLNGIGQNNVGNLWLEYEPYYINTISNITRSSFQRVDIGPGGEGSFRKTYVNDYRRSERSSVTAPAKDVDFAP